MHSTCRALVMVMAWKVKCFDRDVGYVFLDDLRVDCKISYQLFGFAMLFSWVEQLDIDETVGSVVMA